MKIRVEDRTRQKRTIKSVFNERELVELLFAAAKSRDGLTQDLSNHRVSISFVTKKSGAHAVVRMRAPQVAA